MVQPSESWRRWATAWRSPRFWLVGQAVGLLLVWAATGRLATWVHLDSKSYLSTVLPGSLEGTLSYQRTVAYPLLLKLVGHLPGGLDGLASLQRVAFLLAVVGFGLAFARYSGSGWIGLAAATPLFYSQTIVDYGSAVGTDAPGLTLAIATFAALFWLLAAAREGPARPSPRGRRLAWIALGVFLCAAYQVRPAYLFLLPLVPLLGFLLTLRWRGLRAWKVALRSPTLGLALVALLPFLAWSTLRWAVTGHFGLVSFGGTNLIGITASMLSPSLVPELPLADRPLARAILAGRRAQGLNAHGRYRFGRWVMEYNQNVWGIAFKAAEKVHRPHDQTIRQFWQDANRRFTRLSREVIRARPGTYGRWLVDSLGFAVQRIATLPWVRWPALALLLAGIARAARGAGASPVVARRPSPAVDLALLAGLSLAAALVLIVAVEPPIDRYTFAAAVWVPSALVVGIVELTGIFEQPFKFSLRP